MQGIDLSSWQAGINLDVVPYDFLISKATEGTSYVNPQCVSFVEKSLSQGKPTGVYHYATGENATAEADYFVDNVAGWIGKVILCLDWESGGNASWGNKDYVRAFCDRVFERTNVQPIIYVSASAINQAQDVGDRGLWVAQYADMNPTGYQDTPWNEGAYDCLIRQYSSMGSLPGYNGGLDLNKSYIDATVWAKYAMGSRDGASTPVVNNPSPEPSVNTSHSSSYTVQSGDSLSSIASQFGTSWQKIAQDNGIGDPNVIYPGQVLTISNDGGSSPSRTYTVQNGDSLSSIASQFGTSWQKIAQDNGIGDPNLIYPGQVLTIGDGVYHAVYHTSQTYTVQNGDSLSGIASQFGTSWQSLAQKNGISDPDLIYPGQILNI